MEYPDPDEEFELMYGDELELAREIDEHEDVDIDYRQHPSSRRSLNFVSPASTQPSCIKSSPAPTVSTAPSELPVSAETISDKSCTEPIAGPSSLDDNIVYLQGDSKKRKVEDLFGNIDDLELEELEECLHNRKKKRELSLVDGDAELMRKITDGRKQNQTKYLSKRVLSDSESCSREKSSSISRHFPKWQFIPMTTSNGDRLYVRLRSEEYFQKQVDAVKVESRSLNLLSMPSDKVWQQAQVYLQKLKENVEAQVFEKRIRALEESSADSGCELISEDEKQERKRSDLWVEKYKPRNYMELLSDENTNRTLLHWLKLWDKVVFNRERKVKPKTAKEEKKKPDSGNRFQKKTPTTASNDELDEHGCPKSKLALLCGPPGLGKTTLAHMIARHAGYNVVEMNASDDRSPEAFRSQIEAATQMRAALGQQPRPNCLVIDEIDGAPAASIEVLIKYATGKDVGKGRGKKKSATGILKRPMICICNDVYVPALRPLRQLAFILNFPFTASARLAQRLLEIARKQGIRTDLNTLMALAEKTQNDIRSCLSVLQFFKSQGSCIKLSDVHRSSIGQKDIQKGLFAVWHEIFQIQRPRRQKMDNVPASTDLLEPMPDLDSPDMKCGPLSLASRMRNILQAVQSFGDYDRLTQGVFENYVNMKLRDSCMDGVLLGLEWFCTVDIFMERIYSRQNFTLLPYLPYAFVVWHFLFSSFAWPKLSYPTAAHEAAVKKNRNKDLLSELMKGMHPSIRAYTQNQSLLFDVLPSLLEILVPNLRPVSMQLYSSREKEDLNHVIGTMIDYNLNYVQERTAEGNYVYNLDPNIEDLACFTAIKHSRVLSYNIKQLLTREVQLERVRRTELKVCGAANANNVEKENPPACNSTTDAVGEKRQPVVPNHLQRLKPKTIVESTRIARDFFGRAVECVTSQEIKAKPDEIVKSDIWYHFKEGFSNAVRRSVKMKDLY